MNQNIVECGFMEREEEMDIWREKERMRGGGKEGKGEGGKGK